MNPLDNAFLESIFHFRDGFIARVGMNNEFGEEGIVVRRNLIACVNVRVNPDAGAAAKM